MHCREYSDVLPLERVHEVRYLPDVTRVLDNCGDMRLLVVVFLTEGETSSQKLQKKIFLYKILPMFLSANVHEGIK